MVDLAGLDRQAKVVEPAGPDVFGLPRLTLTEHRTMKGVSGGLPPDAAPIDIGAHGIERFTPAAVAGR